MNIFISWSGRRSQHIARALKTWLPSVHFKIQPWMSEKDIEAGRRFDGVIADALEACKFGIVCVTPENQDRPWLNFEAGAISKLHRESRVFTYLVDMGNADVTGPLGSFQHKAADRSGTEDIVKAINSGMGETDMMPAERLAGQFDKFWPDLEAQLKRMPAVGDGDQPVPRDSNAMIRDILEIVRDLQSRPQLGLPPPPPPMSAEEGARMLALSKIAAAYNAISAEVYGDGENLARLAAAVSTAGLASPSCVQLGPGRFMLGFHNGRELMATALRAQEFGCRVDRVSVAGVYMPFAHFLASQDESGTGTAT